MKQKAKQRRLDARVKTWDEMQVGYVQIGPHAKRKTGGDGATHTWHRPGSMKRG